MNKRNKKISLKIEIPINFSSSPSTSSEKTDDYIDPLWKTDSWEVVLTRKFLTSGKKNVPTRRKTISFSESSLVSRRSGPSLIQIEQRKIELEQKGLVSFTKDPFQSEKTNILRPSPSRPLLTLSSLRRSSQPLDTQKSKLRFFSRLSPRHLLKK